MNRSLSDTYRGQKTQVGMAFIMDHSGKLFKGKKVTLRDVVCNADAAELLMEPAKPAQVLTNAYFIEVALNDEPR